MIAVKMPDGSFVRIGDTLEVESEGAPFASWYVKAVDVEKDLLIVDHTDAHGDITTNLEIPLSMWEGAEMVELTADEVNKDPNLAFRFRKEE
jgi:hypothetical protein